MQNRMDDADNEVRFGAINSFSSFDFAAEIGDRLKPLLADDESISVSLAASDYLGHSGEGRYPAAFFSHRAWNSLQVLAGSQPCSSNMSLLCHTA